MVALRSQGKALRTTAEGEGRRPSLIRIFEYATILAESGAPVIVIDADPNKNVLIRIFEYAGAYQLDLDGAVRERLAYKEAA